MSTKKNKPVRIVDSKRQYDSVFFATELYDYPIGELTPVEIMLLLVLVHELRDKGTEIVTIGMRKMAVCAHLRGKTNQEIAAMIEGFSEKMDGWGIFKLIKWDANSRVLSVQVKKPKSGLFNRIDGTTHPYTKMSIKQISSIKGVYARRLAIFLARYSDTGRWEVSQEKFREALGIEDGYTSEQISQKVINRALPKLKEIYPTLKCIRISPYYDRRQVTGYKFVYGSIDENEPYTSEYPDEYYDSLDLDNRGEDSLDECREIQNACASEDKGTDRDDISDDYGAIPGMTTYNDYCDSPPDDYPEEYWSNLDIGSLGEYEEVILDDEVLIESREIVSVSPADEEEYWRERNDEYGVYVTVPY